jgi:hypothetical protein
MFVFARESQYVTAVNKIMFWMSIFACGLCGILFITGRANVISSETNVYYPALLTTGIVMLFCAVAMAGMMFGKRVGGYAALGFAVLFVVGIAMLSLPTKNYDLFNVAGLSILVLWPTLATLFGAKRINQQEISLKQELMLKGALFGKIMVGALYGLTVLTIIFGLIGVLRS